ncbi:DUF5906 domain-containing protein [Desulfovibrio sp. OttesenSCG-928-C06]|nr:DUF5906 domain-containing protein [Desulfovibrio sp. OttesenSCG-928-C06]
MADNGKDTPDKDTEIKLSVDDIANIPQPDLSSNVADLLDGPISFHHPEQYEAPEIKAYAEQMKEFDSQFFVAYQGGKSLVYREAKDIYGYFALQHYTHRNFIEHYGNRTIQRPIRLSKDKRDIYTHDVPIAREWLNHPDRRTYDGIIFYPGETLPKAYGTNLFNEWRGFNIQDVQGEFPLLEQHLRHIWCRDNEQHYRYLLIWLADLIQHPERKSGIALVVKGEKGTGKSIIFENVLERILGSAYIKIDKPEQVTGKFNQHQYGKLLLVLEEAIWAGDKSAEGALKSMITDKKTVFEAKGIDPVPGDSFVRLAFVSNEKQAVPATADERRFFALKTSIERQGDKQYFRELLTEINGGGLEAFMYHLANLVYTEDEIRSAPRTRVLFEDIEAKMPAFARWCYQEFLRKEQLITDGVLKSKLWGHEVNSKDLKEDYDYWVMNNSRTGSYVGANTITSQTKFTQEFKGLFDLKTIRLRNQSYGFMLPLRAVLRRVFEEKYKTKLDWDDAESGQSAAVLSFPGNEVKQSTAQEKTSAV